jgi:hypothetical protein
MGTPMTDYDWAQIRTTAIRKLGETPNAPTEHDITETFKDNPQLVSSVIDAVIAEKASGVSFRSAWAVIRYRSKTNPAEPIVATDHHERDLRTRQAEAWIRNAGLYIDLERELVSELFDEGGQLHPWRSDTLEAKLVAVWETHRPRGETAEADCERRALERVELRSRLAAASIAARATPTVEPEADPTWHVRPEPELTEPPPVVTIRPGDGTPTNPPLTPDTSPEPELETA